MQDKQTGSSIYSRRNTALRASLIGLVAMAGLAFSILLGYVAA